ncbi:glycoside hydrolase family 2 TIM barrel-domain containing protein [Croceivirga sp. JEA036]|uniref:glycoside hydrolase family 2 TIM barrel-domain containing protein n=1 Tax=Croceivirga sp. JEA036 TaxID=2721162 RepID=UPI00143A9C35|nr:glycoside hydrolase family 2 TIM barrel-domain containing protein [Croceivirga sp. JEA036]NJB35201.1 glycoside hydrolase family 2 protein [Croceivirga sp. JEA036]
MNQTKQQRLYLIAGAFLLSFYGLLAQELPFGYPVTARTKTNLNQGWKFFLGQPEAEFYDKNLDDAQWQSVNVPHTLELTSLTLDGLKDDKVQLEFHRKVGWYRKDFMVPQNQNRVFLEFEGVHQVTDVWVNGTHVGQHATGGYTPFHFDVTDFVQKGAMNQITIKADNRRSMVTPPDPGPFDYVKFSGLYRDVYLVEKAPVHIGFNWEGKRAGVTLTTPTVDVVNKNTTIQAVTEVKNTSTSNEEVTVVTRIIDEEGIVVAKMLQTETILANGKQLFDQITSLEDDVHFWDVDSPYLYRVNTEVILNGKSEDVVENKLGIRSFKLDPEKGFILNGKPIKLIGFNRHQQYPYIGDAVPNALHYKDMLQFKEFGFNIMRTAHYPQDDAILEACDELGILVYEEAPSWISISNEPEWWSNFEKAERTMIRNHKNHSSVVIWGGGINHRGYVPRVHNVAKQEDPTRLTASQGARWTGWQASGLTDINANMLYGPFIWDRSEPMFAMEGHWGPESLGMYRKDQLMTGLISWTAHAYYTFHPTHTRANDPIDRTRSGAETIFRYPRPRMQWYKAELLEEPFVYIVEDWKQGQDSITIYSNAPKVSLAVNGRQIAQGQPAKDSVYQGLHHAPFIFKNIAYKEGELVAKAEYTDGKVLTATKKTPGKACAIQLKLDTEGRQFVADGADILVAYATVVDKNGTVIQDFKDKVKFTVQGDASVIGDNADINANPMFTEYGVAPALIKAGTTVGNIKVKAAAKGLKSDTQTVQLIANQTNEMVKKAQPIYDFAKERVDLGATDQLVQFGWNFWLGKDGENTTYKLNNFGDAHVSLVPKSEDGIVRWLGEMNVIGKYGFVYGDGILGIDAEGIQLQFKGLKKGKYRLKTYHHAPKSNSDQMDPNKEKLKKIRILDIPYENMISVSVGGTSKQVTVTEGKSMQFDAPGQNSIEFEVMDHESISVLFKGPQGKGIWLNGFVLQEWK